MEVGHVTRKKWWYWPAMAVVSPTALVCGSMLVVAALVAGTLAICTGLIAGAVLAPFVLLTERGKRAFDRLGEMANHKLGDGDNDPQD